VRRFFYLNGLNSFTVDQRLIMYDSQRVVRKSMPGSLHVHVNALKCVKSHKIAHERPYSPQNRLRLRLRPNPTGGA